MSKVLTIKQDGTITYLYAFIYDETVQEIWMRESGNNDNLPNNEFVLTAHISLDTPNPNPDGVNCVVTSYDIVDTGEQHVRMYTSPQGSDVLEVSIQSSSDDSIMLSANVEETDDGVALYGFTNDADMYGGSGIDNENEALILQLSEDGESVDCGFVNILVHI